MAYSWISPSGLATPVYLAWQLASLATPPTAIQASTRMLKHWLVLAAPGSGELAQVSRWSVASQFAQLSLRLLMTNFEPYPPDRTHLFTVLMAAGTPGVVVRIRLISLYSFRSLKDRIKTVRVVLSPGCVADLVEKSSRVPPVMTDLNWSRLVMVSQFSRFPFHWVFAGQDRSAFAALAGLNTSLAVEYV
ncbi:hypothetical protein B0E41_23915 [Hydrogenophaga sp. A37]|nr:hypothetical protein B0E41_23915 [Hydrogenophaga sp. A37]